MHYVPTFISFKTPGYKAGSYPTGWISLSIGILLKSENRLDELQLLALFLEKLPLHLRMTHIQIRAFSLTDITPHAHPYSNQAVCCVLQLAIGYALEVSTNRSKLKPTKLDM